MSYELTHFIHWLYTFKQRNHYKVGLFGFKGTLANTTITGQTELSIYDNSDNSGRHLLIYFPYQQQQSLHILHHAPFLLHTPSGACQKRRRPFLQLWNSLEPNHWSAVSLASVKSHLKTALFSAARST